MEGTVQQKALGINAMLMHIYGFVLGTGLNTITKKKKMQMRLISTHFNTCFIAYLKSVPLKLIHGVADTRRAPRERSIVKFMIKYQIPSLFDLRLESLAVNLQQMKSNLSGLDLSNLSVLRFRIKINPSRCDFPNEVQSLLHLFSEAASVTQLTLNNYENDHIDIPYKEFLSYFPILKSLEIFFSDNLPNDKDRAMEAIEEAPQLERLVNYNLKGDFMLRSESLKFLNVCSFYVDSICLICPSLDKLLFLYHPSNGNIAIGNTSGSFLVERFGITNRTVIDQILKYLKMFYHRRGSVTVPWFNQHNMIASVSIIPSDFIRSTDTNLFQVGSNCHIIMLTSNE